MTGPNFLLLERLPVLSQLEKVKGVNASPVLAALVLPDIAVHAPRVAELREKDGDRGGAAMPGPHAFCEGTQPVIGRFIQARVNSG